MKKLTISGTWYNEVKQERMPDGNFVDSLVQNPLTGKYDCTVPDPQKIVLVIKDEETDKVKEIARHFDNVGLTAERVKALLDADKVPRVTDAIPDVDYVLQRHNAGKVATKGIHKGKKSHFFNFYHYIPEEPTEMQF